jgi:hypothetical protein
LFYENHKILGGIIMNEYDGYHYGSFETPDTTDKVIGYLAITGAVAITGLVLTGAYKLTYKISEVFWNKVGDKIFGKVKEEA